MPRPRNEIPTVLVTVRLPEPVALELANRARDHNTSKSALAAQYIYEGLGPVLRKLSFGPATPVKGYKLDADGNVTPIEKEAK